MTRNRRNLPVSQTLPVKLSVLYGRDGQVIEARVIHSPNSALDAQAREFASWQRDDPLPEPALREMLVRVFPAH